MIWYVLNTESHTTVFVGEEEEAKQYASDQNRAHQTGAFVARTYVPR